MVGHTLKVRAVDTVKEKVSKRSVSGKMYMYMYDHFNCVNRSINKIFHYRTTCQ